MSFQFISYFSSQNCQVLRALIWLTGFVLEMQKSTTFHPWGQSGSTPTATRNLFSFFFWQLLPWKENSEKVLRVKRTTGQQIKELLTHWKTVRRFSCQIPFVQVIHLMMRDKESGSCRWGFPGYFEWNSGENIAALLKLSKRWLYMPMRCTGQDFHSCQNEHSFGKL